MAIARVSSQIGAPGSKRYRKSRVRYTDLATRNPGVDPKLLKRYQALYEGGETFRAMIGDFMPANPMESARVYALRQKSAFYRSYVGPVIDFFSAQLFAAPFVVRATVGATTDAFIDDGFYAAFKEDCDGAGTDLSQFMKTRFTEALVKGRSWILTELPEDGGRPASSAAEWTERGLGRATLCKLSPDEVLDWEVGEDGEMEWAITYACAYKRPDPRASRTLKTERWRLYNRTTVQTYEVTFDPKRTKITASTDVPLKSERPHGFPRVPLIPIRLPPGLWLMARCADAQVEHFRQSSALSWATRQACYPMAVFKARNPESEPPRPTGAGYMHTIGLEEEIEFIAPATAPFEVIAAQVTAQKDEIHRIAQQMANSVDNTAASLGRSGDSKAADASATEICLLAYGDVVKDAIEEVYELVSDARGDTGIAFSVEGMTHFKLSDIGIMLDNAGKAGDMIAKSPTLGRELAKHAAELLLPGATQQTKDAIRAEIDASGNAANP